MMRNKSVTLESIEPGHTLVSIFNLSINTFALSNVKVKNTEKL